MISQEAHILLSTNAFIPSLEAYAAAGGLQGLKKARALSPKELIEEVKNSGLRGRGGAGFPAGVKWESVAGDPWRTKYVVCNAAEGEPGTYKDRYLLQRNPYPMLEGTLIAAHAVGAKNVFIGTKRKFIREVERITSAIKEMEAAHLFRKGFVQVVLGPDDYLFGEEKALLEVIDGRGAMPRILPPYMQGARFTPTAHNPTIVNNVETMSHLPFILAHGAEWFRSVGTKDTPGTMIFTLSGDVKNPGMYELPMGTKLHDLLYETGGGPKSKEHPIKAVFSGVANAVITPELFNTPLDFGSMRAAGTGLGSGGLIVYDESVCMIKVALMFSQFLAKESCGQCLPCNMGCRIITQHLAKIEAGRGSKNDLNKIRIECGRVTNQTRCYLPAQEAKLISSIIEKFPQEFEAHIKHGCRHRRELMLPKIEYFDEQSRYFIYEGDQETFKTL